MVATDLDGTLLRSDFSISERTRLALDNARDVNVEVVLVTGRPPRALSEPIRQAIGARGLAVCANGALVYDLESRQVVRQNTIAPEIALAVVEALRNAVPDVRFAVEGVSHFGHEPGYVPLLSSSEALVTTVEELVADPVAKILALHPELPPDDLVAEIREVVAEAVEVTHSSSRGLAEISASGVSKAFALEEIAADLNINRAVAVAFGDMPNDIPMLAWAGHSVAVANAHPDVLAAANEITLSNDEDGVAVVLERLLGAG